MKPILHILTGPTAVGKSDWAIEWALKHDAAIVSCDSLLVYQGMDIGTAKPSLSDRAKVPHYLIDCVPVHQSFNVHDYIHKAQSVIRDCTAQGQSVLVVGGSGFYLKSFFQAVTDDVIIPPEVRTHVQVLFEAQGLTGLVEALHSLNPLGLGSLDVHNPRRVIRALERCQASGQTLHALTQRFQSLPGPFADYTTTVYLMERSAASLSQRIHTRTERMLQDGLIGEVQGLIAQGLLKNASARQAIGYREVIEYLEKDPKPSLDSLRTAIIQNTHQLVRKQRIWFRHQLPNAQVITLD